MARIRSIHPTLFTDEAFAVLSMAARVLLLGLWTEADDQGVFDWKPITLKMRLMPVDNVQVPDLLLELEANNVVKRFSQDGREFGAVRNFCKFQRPKTPKYRQLKSVEIRNYVASKYPMAEATYDEVEPFPQKVEMLPQMEEEGGRRGRRKWKKKAFRRLRNRRLERTTISSGSRRHFPDAMARTLGTLPKRNSTRS
jgi:hypothetical protein